MFELILIVVNVVLSTTVLSLIWSTQSRRSKTGDWARGFATGVRAASTVVERIFLECKESSRRSKTSQQVHLHDVGVIVTRCRRELEETIPPIPEV